MRVVGFSITRKASSQSPNILTHNIIVASKTSTHKSGGIHVRGKYIQIHECIHKTSFGNRLVGPDKDLSNVLFSLVEADSGFCAAS